MQYEMDESGRLYDEIQTLCNWSSQCSGCGYSLRGVKCQNDLPITDVNPIIQTCAAAAAAKENTKPVG